MGYLIFQTKFFIFLKLDVLNCSRPDSIHLRKKSGNNGNRGIKTGTVELVHTLGSVPGMLLSFPQGKKTYHIHPSSITGYVRAGLDSQLIMKKILINKRSYFCQSL
jgi:hypothetical protein